MELEGLHHQKGKEKYQSHENMDRKMVINLVPYMLQSMTLQNFKGNTKCKYKGHTVHDNDNDYLSNFWISHPVVFIQYFFHTGNTTYIFLGIYFYAATCSGLSCHHQAYKYKRKVFRVKASPFHIKVGYSHCMEPKIFQICANYKTKKL
jgi:hypothetical protein